MATRTPLAGETGPPAARLPLVSLAQGAEGLAELTREQLGLLPGGEVAARVDLVEVDEVVVGLLDPVARGLEDLAGEHREGHRERDVRGRLLERSRDTPSVLPVQPRGRGRGVRQPVQRDVVEDVVPGEVARGLPVEE